jgi:hypothetical protein
MDQGPSETCSIGTYTTYVPLYFMTLHGIRLIYITLHCMARYCATVLVFALLYYSISYVMFVLYENVCVWSEIMRA